MHSCILHFTSRATRNNSNIRTMPGDNIFHRAVRYYCKFIQQVRGEFRTLLILLVVVFGYAKALRHLLLG